jgi:putative tricarboxylic transport membrane protein
MPMEARRPDWAGIAIAAGLMVIAAAVWWDMTGLNITTTYGIGPEAAPMVVASGLALLAIGNLVTAIRGQLPERESADPRAFLLILGGLAALIALIAFGGGFIFATAILFAATSAAFGRKAFVTDLAIGFVLALVIFLIFDKLLTLSLPAGPLERLL